MRGKQQLQTHGIDTQLNYAQAALPTGMGHWSARTFSHI